MNLGNLLKEGTKTRSRCLKLRVSSQSEDVVPPYKSRQQKSGLGMDFDRSSCSFTLQSRSNSPLPSLVAENNSRGRTFCEENSNWLSCWKVFFMPDIEFQSGWEERS